MYDMINGEAVKCFPIYYMTGEAMNCSEGNLISYDTGDPVPYITPYYNYGKNFLVIDINGSPEFYEGYDFLIHVITDGFVKETLKNTFKNINWDINSSVVNYNGEILNIHSEKEALDYIDAQKKYWHNIWETKLRLNVLRGLQCNYFCQIKSLEEGSKDRKTVIEKISRNSESIKEEFNRTAPELERIRKEFSTTWIKDTSDIDDLILIGKLISCYNLAHSEEESGYVLKSISDMLNKDKTLRNRYVEWQGTDEHIKKLLEQFFRVILLKLPTAKRE